MIGNILNKVLLICLSLICLKGQDQLDIKNAEYMPFHTKILWGENGLIRKTNLAPATRKEEVELRVKMLQTHQKLALVSLGLLAYQYSLGLELADGDYSNLSSHKTFSKVTWSAYMTSASLSYFAPPALIYEKRVSSMKIHRWLSYMHFAGMMSIPVLGKNISISTNRVTAITTHQDVATATLISMILSGLLTILPY
tara:strand:- start:246 stop:836 length:591 start_codon:yes stop_codon:yes gene_type:complete